MARQGNVRLRLAAALCALLSFFSCTRAPLPVVLATTTSVGNSGLLDLVLPQYKDAPVRPLLVGSGRALQMLANGSADVVISHAPVRERQMLDSHPSWWYRKILFNDFVIVGLPEDPAAVRGAADAAEAMRRIARARVTFLSRGDESGTHERERELWAAAGARPGDSLLVTAGAGMGQTLRIASSTGAYTLTDRGTFTALAGSIKLVVLHEGDDRLLNTYAVLADPANVRGLAFAKWVSEGKGRDVLLGSAEGGVVKGFSVWPRDVAATTPEARPR